MIVYCFLSLLLGVLGAWAVSRYGAHLGLVDIPSARSSHTLPTPKGGGIGIVLAFVAGCIVYDISAGFYLPATALSLLSLFGDRMEIHPLVRLIVQFAAAFLVLFSPGFLAAYALPANVHGIVILYTVALIIVAAIFIAGTANFFNFMDGINGIAAVTGMVGFGLLAVYGVIYQKTPALVVLCLGLVAACAGFLPFNVPKARVFMGDAGSVLLGFVFAAVVLSFSSTLMEFVLLAGFLYPFYADELVTMVERIRDRQSLTDPHRRHLYQVLANEAGIVHWKISIGYGGAQLVAGLFLWQASRFGTLWFSMVFAALGLVWILINNRIKGRFVGN